MRWKWFALPGMIALLLAGSGVNTVHARVGSTNALLRHLGPKGTKQRKTTDRETSILLGRLVWLRDNLKRADKYLGYIKKVSNMLNIIDKALFVGKNVSLALKPAPAPVNPAASNTNMVLTKVYNVVHPLKQKVATLTVHTEKIRANIQRAFPQVERSITYTTRFQHNSRRFRTTLSLANQAIEHRCSKQTSAYRNWRRNLDQFSFTVDRFVQFVPVRQQNLRNLRVLKINTALYTVNRPLDIIERHLRLIESVGNISKQVDDWMRRVRLQQVLRQLNVVLTPIDKILSKRFRISLNIILVPRVPKKCTPQKCISVPNSCRKKVCLKKKILGKGIKRCKTFKWPCRSVCSDGYFRKKVCIKKRVKIGRRKRTFRKCKTIKIPCKNLCTPKVCTPAIKERRFVGVFTNSLKGLLQGVDAGIAKVKQALIKQAKNLAKKAGIDASKMAFKLPLPAQLGQLLRKAEEAQQAASHLPQRLDDLTTGLKTLSSHHYARLQKELTRIPKISCRGGHTPHRPHVQRPTARRRPVAIFYEHYHFRGRSFAFYGGQKELRGSWNDRVSSVKVLRGSVRLFQHYGYRGSSRVIRGNVNLAGAWNDQVSSVRAEGTPRKAVARQLRNQSRYLGCYLDRPRRMLPRFVGNGHSPKSCIAMCRRLGQRYAGLQAKQQCFCGNSLRHRDKRRENECSAECIRARGYRCGASWRNSVYRVQ